ncbi:SDR family oxidoreductase [Alicyclobacillus fastidiosus]|uniref:SDR family oxidoreductase n=1 Tax=Alicyclobacillus fastidiosus TaxID=392011 RepID=A0ABY6ZGH1_9BACL|nr:SDR family NAD(P)-dependent oxidoreductase [Alicyclobacillus fastidiosus]WAH41225.1 SDR family oxidoreductase [Alicyclobacillus fastidiosus]GMA62813.1 3-oxoacyl-ACP reductase [Alicyclobacillus fastidiosus]
MTVQSNANLFDVSGKTVLITGGARGLGRNYGEAFVQHGCHVVLGDIDADLVKQTATELNQLARTTATCEGIELDVTNEEQVEAVVRHVVDTYGDIDVVINNAGIVDRVGVEEMTLDAWNRTMGINLTGVFLVSKYVAREMIQRRTKGSIINMASMSGEIVNVPMEQAAYNTSKAAVAMFTKSCAVEWAEYGIRVNAIAPGYMKTDMTGPDFEPGGKFYHLLDAIPMRRLGLPNELSGLALFLASEASSYITGAVMNVDGGYTLI